MSGAIINIIYGIEIDLDEIQPDEDYHNPNDKYDDGSEAVEAVRNMFREEAYHGGPIGGLYSAYGDDPMYFGIKIEECYEGGSIDGDFLIERLKVNDNTKNQFKVMWDNLDEELRDAIIKYFGDSPKSFVLWSNS